MTLRLSFLVAALSTSASLASAQPPPAFTDVYYVQFAKALPGQAPALEKSLKQLDPKIQWPRITFCCGIRKEPTGTIA